jgi:transcriptional regulator with XRE-family HTH domain
VTFPTPAEDGAEWLALLVRIHEQLCLSQLEIAARCGVARQTVSAWMHGRRTPSMICRRKLMLLAAEQGIPGRDGVARDAGSLAALLERLPEEARREVLDFARFKLVRLPDRDLLDHR